MDKREYNAKHPVFSKLKTLIRAFKKPPRIIDLNENTLTPALFIANHSAAGGPFTYELYFPHYAVPWGTYQMCGTFKERWNYLYHTFYQQKLGWSKVPAFIVASLFAPISKMLYNGAELIPTYPDARFKRTLRKSMEVLESGRPVLVFPENSSDGYHELLKEYHPGFVMLAQKYKKQTGGELPIYSVYYSGKDNTIVIDKAITLAELSPERRLNKEHIAEVFKNRTNGLYNRYLLKNNK